jgi:hypothetical protein
MPPARPRRVGRLCPTTAATVHTSGRPQTRGALCPTTATTVHTSGRPQTRGALCPTTATTVHTSGRPQTRGAPPLPHPQERRSVRPDSTQTHRSALPC